MAEWAVGEGEGSAEPHARMPGNALKGDTAREEAAVVLVEERGGARVVGERWRVGEWAAGESSSPMSMTSSDTGGLRPPVRWWEELGSDEIGRGDGVPAVPGLLCIQASGVGSTPRTGWLDCFSSHAGDTTLGVLRIDGDCMVCGAGDTGVGGA